ncbi:MAG TPA: FlgO family outer membrane protein [Gemmatimonadaceae bacterium]|nr:FlgO family outer membrane protein [Gemmatimonadaceae bacterium]
MLLQTLLLLTALTTAETTLVRRPPPAPAPAKTLAVLYFDNRTGNSDYDPLGKGLAAMMITDLAAVEELQVVEREHLQSVLAELERQRSPFFDQATAVKAGKLVGAQYILAGQITAVKPRVRLDTRVINVETSEIVKTAQVTGDEDKFFELQQKLARNLVDGLSIALSPEAQEKLQVQQESNRIDRLNTMVQLSQAMALFDRGEYPDALLKMGPVVRSQPKSLIVQLTYEEMKRRAAAKTNQKAKEKTRDFIRGILKPD